MSDSTRTQLKKLLVARYTSLIKRFERVAGSKEHAADAVHDVWLRLEAMPSVTPVANADAYLVGMVSNAVTDQYRREKRHVHEEEVDELFDVPDELADPERILSARRKVEELKAVLMGLPPRRRAILLAARVEGQLNREIAEYYGISLSMVEKELGEAMRHCAARMEELIQPEGLRKGRRKF
jgi:RNA polymerase sigma factor (sigma-70 family)